MHDKTQKALDELRSGLHSGRFGVDFLFSERKLCTGLRVGRGALRSMLETLEQENRITRIPGLGMRINSAFGGNKKFRRFLTIAPSTSPRFAESMAILAGIAGAASERSAEMVLLFDSEHESGGRISERIAAGGFDGVIFLENFTENEFQLAGERKVPAIIANLENESEYPSVSVDCRQIGRLAGRFLVEHGHRNIGFFGGSTGNRFIYRDMFAGLKGALAEDDIEVNRDFVMFEPVFPDEDSVRMHLAKLLKNNENRPTAFFVGRDSRARLFCRVCGELKLRIPEDISVISYDNLSWDEAAASKLTTIAQPAYDTGYRALELLYDARTAGKPIVSVKLPGTLVERGSVKTISR